MLRVGIEKLMHYVAGITIKKSFPSFLSPGYSTTHYSTYRYEETLQMEFRLLISSITLVCSVGPNLIIRPIKRRREKQRCNRENMKQREAKEIKIEKDSICRCHLEDGRREPMR